MAARPRTRRPLPPRRRDASTVDEIRAAFEEAFELLGVRLYAVLVTRSGQARDKVLRIVTPWINGFADENNFRVRGDEHRSGWHLYPQNSP